MHIKDNDQVVIESKNQNRKNERNAGERWEEHQLISFLSFLNIRIPITELMKGNQIEPTRWGSILEKPNFENRKKTFFIFFYSAILSAFLFGIVKKKTGKTRKMLNKDEKKVTTQLQGRLSSSSKSRRTSGATSRTSRNNLSQRSQGPLNVTTVVFLCVSFPKDFNSHFLSPSFLFFLSAAG